MPDNLAISSNILHTQWSLVLDALSKTLIQTPTGTLLKKYNSKVHQLSGRLKSSSENRFNVFEDQYCHLVLVSEAAVDQLCNKGILPSTKMFTPYENSVAAFNERLSLCENLIIWKPYECYKFLSKCSSKRL